MATETRARSLRECADELGLKSDATLKAAIRAGRLRALVLSGKADPKAPGPKLYRVEPDEWERFKRSIRTQGGPEAGTDGPEATPTPTRKAGRPKKGAEKPSGRMSGYR